MIVGDPARTQIDRKVYSVVDSPLVQTSTAADVLRQVPLVRVNPDGGVSLAGVPSVRILVDGKETANVTVFLRSLPASRIERIEVLTNPSGEFAGDGQSGVINIVLKRNFADGFSGSISTAVDRFGSIEGRIGPVWSSGGWTLTALVAPTRFVGPTDEVRRLHPVGSVDGKGRLLEQRSGRGHINTVMAMTTLTRRFGGDGSLQLSLLGNYADGQNEHDDRFAAIRQPDQTVAGRSSGDVALRSHRENLSYQDASGPFGGDLSVSVSREAGELRSELETDSGGIPVVASSTRYDFRTWKAELTSKFKFGGDLLSAGTQLEDGRTRGGSLFSYFDNDGSAVFVGMTSFAGTIVKADAFASYQFRISDLKLLGSLRLETRDYEFETTGATGQSRSYARLAPSFHVERPIGKRLTARSSYSRRFTYPGISDLDPALQLSGPFSGRRGNPALLPQSTQTFELGGEGAFGDHKVVGLLSHRVTDDLWLTEQRIEGDNLVVSRSRNFGRSRSTGFAVEADGPLLKPLKYELSGSCSRYAYDGDGSGGAGDFECLASVALKYREAGFNAPDGDMIDLNFDWTGASETPLTRYEPYWTLNLNWSHRFSRRLSSSLQINDLFDTEKRRLFYVTPDGLIEQFGGSAAPRVKFTLTYQIGRLSN